MGAYHEDLKENKLSGGVRLETHKMTDRLPDPMIDAMMRYAYELGNYLLTLAN